MKQNRFWLELVTLCAIASLALAFGIATLGVSAVLAFAKSSAAQNAPVEKYQPGEEHASFSGVLTCSICGAKHDKRMNQSAAGCTKMCLKKGASYALVDGDKVYKLQGNDEYLDKYAGERVTVSGTLSGDTLQVSSVEPMNR
ncbi:MAG TPA: hypothetical protein VFJ47_14680 [Terriglobales bacterium]|nr:hypothetical protein [Terriglobales bacterium]